MRTNTPNSPLLTSSFNSIILPVIRIIISKESMKIENTTLLEVGTTNYSFTVLQIKIITNQQQKNYLLNLYKERYSSDFTTKNN